MRFCVVEWPGDAGTRLAVERDGGLVPLDAPASLRGALEQYGPDGLMRLAARATGDALPVDRVARWCPPVPDPRTFRDFYAFEQHVKTCREKRGQDMLPEWYEFPVFYFSNPSSMKGHNEPVSRPASTKELDLELEVGCVIGKEARDVSGDAADDAIFGYMVLNDLSARDLQRQEMKCMLGPAKGKDFATAIGPWLVTKDDLADVRVGPGRYDLAMVARKNGKEISRGNMTGLTHDFTKMIERASRDVTLFPGDVIGSGTVGTGCILELGPEATDGWLEPGDTIELEIDRLGVLTTPIT
ncbi:MAG: fumarylacetoacetate hydrolase family protein [Phycisphaerae bacterium]